MRQRWIAVVLGLVLSPMQLPPLVAQTQSPFEITDFHPPSVQYPTGPEVVVRNHSYQGVLEAWVVRHLDGAIVRKYPVVWVDNLWKKSLDVTQPKNDRLQALVLGENTSVPFTLAFLDADHVIQGSKGFNVRVTSTGIPTGIHYPPDWPQEWNVKIASGKFSGIKEQRLALASTTKGSVTSFILEHDTTVTKAGRLLYTNELRSGDMLAVTYTDQQGNKIAKEVAVEAAWWKPLTFFAYFKKPDLATRPYLSPGARFQAGTVAGIKKLTNPQSHLQDSIVETKPPRGSRQWRVTEETEILRGKLTVSVSEIKTGDLVAVGATELKSSPIPAVRVLLLKDFSAP